MVPQQIKLVEGKTPVSRFPPDHPNWLWFLLRTFFRMVMPIWLRYRARGWQHVPRSGPAILVINHQSFLDPALAGLPFARPVRYLARDTLFRTPIMRWILHRTFVIPIDREKGGSSLRIAIGQLQQGALIGIFPEGTRSDNGEIGPLKPGFVILFRRAGAPIIPVGIAGSGASLPRHAWFPRPKTCRVVYGEPLLPEALQELGGRGEEQKLLDEVRARMVQCYNEAQAWRK